MLWDSIRKNSEHNVRVILEANFPVDAPLSPLGMTALHFACSHSTKEVINTILSFHPNINSRDYLGRTPLHMAMASNNSDAVEILLLQPNIDLNSQSIGGETPLFKGIQFQSKNAVISLLRNEVKPDLYLANNSGMNSYQLAELAQRSGLLQVLNYYYFPQQDGVNDQDVDMQE
eukprot:403337019